MYYVISILSPTQYGTRKRTYLFQVKFGRLVPLVSLVRALDSISELRLRRSLVDCNETCAYNANLGLTPTMTLLELAKSSAIPSPSLSI